MIRDFLKLWDFLTYYGLKSHVNVNEGLEMFSEERIRVGKEEAGPSDFNQAYDKLQAKQDKDQTKQLLELVRQKVHGQINQWHLIMIISIAIQDIPAKVCTDSFVAVNLYPRHRITFHEWIKNISPAVKTGETAYFRNHEGSYYDSMSSVWKNMYIPVQRDVMCIIECFVEEAAPGKSPWTKEMFCSLVCFYFS